LYPLTYDRLISIPKEGRFRIERGWRSLLLNLQNRHTQYERVWTETIFPQTERPFNSISLQDEFDSMYQYFPAEQRLRKCGWNDGMTDTVTEGYFQLPKESITVQLFSIPFQDSCLVLINNQELFLMQMQRHKDDRQDMRRLALTIISQNTLMILFFPRVFFKVQNLRVFLSLQRHKIVSRSF
jgi:hypothetical protein